MKKSPEEPALVKIDPEEFERTCQQCSLEKVAELVPPETPVDATALAMTKESEQLCNERGVSNVCDNGCSKQKKTDCSPKKME